MRAFAAPVMATGIVAEALALDGRHTPADVLLAVAVALAVVLAARLAVLVVRDRARVARAASAPGALTAVAAMGVVGTGLNRVGAPVAGAAMLAGAVVAWVPLLAAVLRGWRRPARGDGFLVSVSTQAIAVLCAALAARGGAVPALAAVAFLAAGLGLYLFAVVSFDPAEIRRGRGDQWVAGGALAIAALAAASAAQALRVTHLGALVAPLRAAALGLWALAMAWLPVLVPGEALAPRRGLHARRWSTVFPLGMYAAMSHVVGTEAAVPWIGAFGAAWTPVAVAAWAVVAAGSVLAAARPRESVR